MKPISRSDYERLPGKKKLFYDGWGNQNTLDQVDKMWDATEPPSDIDIKWENVTKSTEDYSISTGYFTNKKYFDLLPSESRTVKIILVKPKENHFHGGVFYAPTSREVAFNRRLRIAKKLASEGIATVLIDNPFMGRRKPLNQFKTVIAKFSDYPLMIAACIEENRMVLTWMKSMGIERICATGLSQGAFTSAVAAMKLPFDVKVIAVAPPNSAEDVILRGIPGRLCAWDVLENTCPSRINAMDDMRKVFNRTRLDGISLPNTGTTIHLVAALSDKFIPSISYSDLAKHWKDIGTIEWRVGGHVSTCLDSKSHLNLIRKAFVSEVLYN
jgi:hypothetical protein